MIDFETERAGCLAWLKILVYNLTLQNDYVKFKYLIDVFIGRKCNQSARVKTRGYQENFEGKAQ